MKYLVENLLPLAVISIDAKENMRERVREKTFIDRTTKNTKK